MAYCDLCGQNGHNESDHKPPKVAIYARVSKDETANSGQLQDPQNQIEPLRQYCKAKGWHVYKEFIDRASGGNSNRPEFQKMLRLARGQHIKIILVWSLDRFSREPMINTLSYIKQLKHYGCGLVSLQESWLDTTQEGIGELMIAIFAWVAEQEKKRISERTKAGLAKLKARGVKLGRPKKQRLDTQHKGPR